MSTETEITDKEQRALQRKSASALAAHVKSVIAERATELTERAVTAALAGDPVALRLCIDRLSPPVKAESPSVEIPGLKSATGLAGRAAAVIDAVAAGIISSTAATELLAAIASAAKVIEAEELASRIAAIEVRLGIGTGPAPQRVIDVDPLS